MLLSSESINGQFRGKRPNAQGFVTLLEAQVVIEDWQQESNGEPMGSAHRIIRDPTPMKFIHHHQAPPTPRSPSMALA